MCSDRIARHLEALAGEREIVRLRHPIDIKRLSPPGEIRERPRRAVLLGNYAPGAAGSCWWRRGARPGSSA